jgi:RNA polymerase sigma-70 factor (ECF subfamily)
VSRPHRASAWRADGVANTDVRDVDLVARAKLGQREAFDLLVRKYQGRILKLTLRYTRNLTDAEDASQEAFIKAYQGLGAFRGECAFYTWLHRIASRCASNVLAARARDPMFGAYMVSDDDASFEAAGLRDMDTPEDMTVTSNIEGVVSAALEALPAAHRTAIMYREIDGLTYEEIGAAMTSPIGTVRSRVYRAREMIDYRLRAVFEGGLGRRSRRRPHLTASVKKIAAAPGGSYSAGSLAVGA